MKRVTIIGLIIVLAANSLSFAEQLEYKSGSVIVRFKDPGTSTTAKNNIINTALNRTGNRVKSEFSVVKGLTLVQLPADINVDNAIAALKQSSSVAYAVPNYRREIFLVPNDTSFNNLWAMRNIGQTGGKTGADISAVAAWDFSTGSSSSIVAVTDTGTDYTHPDLAANMWHNPSEIPGNGIDDDGDGYVDDYYGVDTGDSDGDPMDDSADPNHGTHVSGTIGAVGNNNRGVTGVCWNVKIMAVKIADSNGILWDDAIIRGIQYAVSKGVKVINASWGGPGFDQALYDAIASARDAGILFVAAAGNSNGNSDASPIYPAAFNLDNIISVMATDDTDQRSYYSNYGLISVDLGAPGGAQQYEHDPRGIYSTIPGNQYDYYQGTSMASPHVAGACALLLSIDPTLTYSQVRQILLDTVDKELPGLCVSGGRMNLAAAAQEAAVDTTPPTPNPPQWATGAAPKATGLHTVIMKASAVTDRSGVEYYFECVNDVSKNSGWTANTLFSLTTLNPNTTYGFHFKARDKSAGYNETDWSTTGFVTTSAISDDLAPFPDPPQWLIPPKANPRTNQIRMAAGIGYDESTPVQYQFSYQYLTNPEVILPWQSSNLYDFNTPSSDPTIVYHFRFHVRDANGNETDEWSPIEYARMFSGSRVLSVPIPYPTIQNAIDNAGDGDIIEVSPGVYYENNISFGGLAITVKSLDPTNPAIVDCFDGDVIIVNDYDTPFIRRGFIFNSGEGADSILDGIAIRDGVVFGGFGMPGFLKPGPAAADGSPGLDALGGAILCGTDWDGSGTPSSPTIRNCIITNCQVMGGVGGDGNDGLPALPGPPIVPAGAGGNGGNSGEAHGGGIYVSSGSNPLIQNCTISNCATLAGSGGNGGAGGLGAANVAGGAGGDGGNVMDFSGGGIYVEISSNPSIIGGTVSSCVTYLYNATPGIGGPGGLGVPQGANGSDGLTGFGSGGGLFFDMSASSSIDISAVDFTSNFSWDNGGGAGFGYFFGGSQVTLSGCQFNDNYAGNGDGIGNDVFDEEGGGLWFANALGTATLQLTNCSFSNNIAERTGGGLKAGILDYPLGSKLQIYGSSFSENSAQEGGAIYIDQAELFVTNSTLTDNQASEGGAINGYLCDFGIENSQLTGNQAISPAGIGGGVAFWNSDGDINNCLFSNNTANSFGGAAFMDGWTTSPLRFTNCLITDNEAFYEGGALSCNLSGWAKLINCTLVGNSATNTAFGTGGAISCAENFAWVQLENCILWENLALNGPQIAVGSIFGSSPDGAGPFADVDVASCDVEGGADDVFIEDWAYTAVWWLAGNITDDPLFVDVDVNEPAYYLSQVKAGQSVNSPCLDAGDFDAIDLQFLVGQTLTTRTDSVEDANTVDIGYHYTAGVAKQYNLTIDVYVFDPNEGGHGRLTAQSQPGSDYQFDISDTNTIQISQATDVNLIAVPDPCYKVQYWSGTDNDGSTALTNAVTMNDDKRVVVAFAPDGWYYLTVSIVSGEGNVTPLGRTLRGPGEVVTLTAIPDNPADKIAWTGTDDDVSQAQTNTVTMDSHKNVTIEFYTPRILYVGGDSNYPTIQAAIDAANERDIVMLMPSTQPYYTQQGFTITKDITITSVDPYNPEVVASTIIQQQMSGGGSHSFGPAFDFEGVTPLMRLQGITIRGFSGGGYQILPANPTTDGYYDGGPGGVEVSYGLYCYYASPTILNCVIDDCHVFGDHGGNGAGGDADHPNGGNGGWPGGAYGGALYMEFFSNPVLIGCTFSNNTVIGGNGGDGGNGAAPPTTGEGGRGGGWYYGYDIPSPWERTPPGNPPIVLPKDYSGLGGAVYINTGCAPVFENCSFVNNSSIGGLNGICGQYGAIPNPVDEPTIRYKIANLGGAIYLSAGASAIFNGCEFTGNVADTSKEPASFSGFVSYGGAVAAEDGATPTFIDCSINGNTSDIGGGLYSSWAYPTIEGGGFSANTAAHGGGVLIANSDAVISGSRFIFNSANISGSEGGAITLLGSNAEINDCNISNNSSAGDGGGIYVSSRNIDGSESDGSSILIKNCLITYNSANLDGGGVAAAWYSDPNIVNCTIANNTAGSYGAGVSSSYGSFINLVDSIIWDNVTGIGANGAQLAISVAPSAMLVHNSDVQGATDPNQFGKDIQSLDLVFCIDTTGSMADDIDAVKAAAGQIINQIVAQFPDYRVAEVNYRDFYDDMNTAAPYGSPGDLPYADDVNFTTDTVRLIAGLQPMTAGGGADGPESVYAGLMHCIDANALEVRLIANGNARFVGANSPGVGAWRQGSDVLRVIMLMGDAPPHDPEPYTNYTLNDIAMAATGRNPIHIMPILIGSDTYATESFTSIATATGGTVVQAADANAVVDAVLEAIDLMKQIPTPIFVDVNCLLNWDPCTMQWEPGSGNINADPCFVSGAGYFLSQIAAGQIFTSPCVDAGSDEANVPGIDLANYTTRTDSVGDQNIVDMGYHYPFFTPPQYRLDFNAVVDNGLQQSDLEPNSGLFNWFRDVNLIVHREPGSFQVLWTGTDNDDSNALTNTVLMDGPKAVTVAFVSNTCVLTTEVIGGHGTISVSPEGPVYSRNTVVTLTAIPDAGYRIKAWTGTDDDGSFALTNSVKMAGDKHVTVGFEVPGIKTVPGDFTTIQSAINAARQGDIVSVASGVYQSSAILINKEVTLTSTNPDDPCVAALTIIDSSGFASPAIIFSSGATANTVLNGFTITGGTWFIVDAAGDVAAGQNGIDGGSATGGAVYIGAGASPTIKNCVIRDTTITGGNATDGGNADATVAAGHGGWPGGAYGGGVYVSGFANPTLINCTIRDCTVIGGNAGNGGNSSGGVFGAADYRDANYGGSYSNPFQGVGNNYLIPPQPWWQMSSSSGQPYRGDYGFYSGLGGGVFCDINSSATFISCNILNNDARGGMSGVGGTRPQGIVNADPVTAYRIPSYGGGVYCGENSSIEFVDCNITSNLAPKPDVTYHTDPYLGHGGGIAFENTAYVSLTGCNISDNISAVGGGMFWLNSEPAIRDCNISANIAYVGGGIYGQDGAPLIEDCNIYRNFAGISTGDVDVIAGQGGGIFGESMNANIIDCRFVDNTTDASGAGIYFHGPVSGGDSTANVTNCLMIGNTAGRDGGGISANWNILVDIVNCTLHSNNATGDFGDPNGHTGLGGGLYCAYGAITNVIDSIIWRNDADLGPEIAVDTGFELDPHCGSVSVSYSDVRGSSAGVYIGEAGNCSANLTWGSGNIGADPKFVSEIISDYRLQQITAGQTVTSPCVETGSTSAVNAGLALYTTRIDEVPDRGIVDMGYHYLVEQPCRFVDIGNKILTGDRTKWMKDGIIDWTDFAILADAWLNSNCSAIPASSWCKGADLTFDGFVNLEDLALVAQCWLASDETAPSPSPSQWRIIPTGTWPDKVKMAAVDSIDNLWGLQYDTTHPVKYFFQCTSGNGHDRDWGYEANYIDTGLQQYTEYAYRVRARDLRGNMTEWSSVQWTVISPDSHPPTPNPMTWAIEPYAVPPSSISMTATTAADDSGGIQYEFEVNEPGVPVYTSGWRDQTTYDFNAPSPIGPYCFRVRARDAFDNETDWSAEVCVSNLGDVEPPEPAPTIIWIPGQWDGTPEGTYTYSSEFRTSDWRWWHRVVADVTGITDDSGGPIEIRFICSSNGFSSEKKVPDPIIIDQGGILGGHNEGDTYQVFWNGNTIVYDVYVDTSSGLGPTYTWTVCVYDPTQNPACSDPHVIGPQF
jgi:subtilisin family serine protease